MASASEHGPRDGARRAADPTADAEIGIEIELRLEHAVAGGAVIARPEDGPVVLVEGGLPDERVRVRIDARQRTLWRGTVVDVVEPSIHRVGPPCPAVARGCGGCDLQHGDAAVQWTMKQQIVVDALVRLGRIADAADRVRPGPVLSANGFRTTVRGGVDGSGHFAFRHRRGHDLVDTDHCLVAHPLVDELIADGRFGSAREVTIRAGAGTGERLVVVDPTVDEVTVPDDVLVVGLDELRAGKRAWFHEVVHDRTFRVSARSFFQSRPDGAAALVDLVLAAARADHATRADPPAERPAVDAYCGVGLFAAFLAADGHPVIAVERHRSSMADAKVNLTERHRRPGRDHHDPAAPAAESGGPTTADDISLIGVDVERWRPSPARLVVADPSRDGLGRRAVERLVATGADRVVLVSCDPAALGRDARLLGERGYQLEGSTIVDLFPHTHHVEVVSRFDRPPT